MKTVIVNKNNPQKDTIISPNKQFSITEDELSAGDVWSIDEDGSITIIQIYDQVELMHHVFQNTLATQAHMMRSITSWCYIVISGEIELFDPVVSGTILSLQELGIIVTFVPDRNLAARISGIIARDHDQKRVDPARDFVVTTDGEALLMCLPGIGPKKLAIVLDECGSVAYAIQSLSDPSITTSTITKSQKEKIRKALELDDQSMLAVIPIDSNEVPNG